MKLCCVHMRLHGLSNFIEQQLYVIVHCIGFSKKKKKRYLIKIFNLTCSKGVYLFLNDILKNYRESNFSHYWMKHGERNG